jgi:hypothetical protein
MHESGFGRVIGVLISPDKTFRSIAERPTWAVPLVLLVLLGLCFSWIAQHRVDPGEMAKYQMEALGMDLNQQQLEEIESKSADQSPLKLGAQMALGAAGIAVLYLILAALFLGVFRLTGSEIDFRRSLSVILHGMLPLGLVAGLLNIVLGLSRAEIRPEQMMHGLLLSNLRPLAPEESPVLASLLESVDFFTIWSVVLLILGFRTVARVSNRTATAVVLVLWGLWVLGKAGFVAVFS